MKNLIKVLLKPFKSTLVFFSEVECFLAKKWVASAHGRLFKAQWGFGSNPEFFDHHIDLFFKWSNTRVPYWVERGIFGRLCLAKDANLLELSCGDGFNSRNFYSGSAKSVIACDFDPSAIATANKKNSAPNLKFILADIRTHMPEGVFDNVVWDAAIEHFSPKEIEKIMKDIKSRLKPNGVLSGYTLVEKDDGEMHIHQHEYEFKDMNDLKRFLSPHFKNVTVFETVYAERHNLYFWASDSVLPFSDHWQHWTEAEAQKVLSN